MIKKIIVIACLFLSLVSFAQEGSSCSAGRDWPGHRGIPHRTAKIQPLTCVNLPMVGPVKWLCIKVSRQDGSVEDCTPNEVGSARGE